ncbi:MAG: VOC family protein, partial [Anaerolineae bacterium]
MKLHKIDHVGIVVKDFATALAFFLELGLEVQGEGIAEGDWVGNVIGLQDVKVAYAMLWTPDGGANIELIHFHRPPAEEGSQQSVVNTPGIRHLAFVVED